MPGTDPRTLTTLPLPRKGWEPPTAESRVRLIKPLLPPPQSEWTVGAGQGPDEDYGYGAWEANLGPDELDTYPEGPDEDYGQGAWAANEGASPPPREPGGLTWSQALERDPNKTEGPATDYGLDAWSPYPGPGAYPREGPSEDYGRAAARTPYNPESRYIGLQPTQPEPARDDWARNWESWEYPRDESAPGPPEEDTSGAPTRDDWRYEYRPRFYTEEGGVMPWAQPLDKAYSEATQTIARDSGAAFPQRGYHMGITGDREDAPFMGAYYYANENDMGTPVRYNPRYTMGERPSAAAREFQQTAAHEIAHGVSNAHDPYHDARTVELMARHPEIYDLFLNVIQDLDSRGRWHPYGRIPAGRPGYAP